MNSVSSKKSKAFFRQLITSLVVILFSVSAYAYEKEGIAKNVAQIAKTNSVNSFIYVSSLGANSNSSGLYLKYKGQVEEELNNLNFPKLAILRPSILLGERKENRVGEKIGVFVIQMLSPLFFGNLKKILFMLKIL